METVFSCSLLMAFSAAVTVFTISVCFPLSSLCEEEEEEETSAHEPQPSCSHAEKMPDPNKCPEDFSNVNL